MTLPFVGMPFEPKINAPSDDSSNSADAPTGDRSGSSRAATTIPLSSFERRSLLQTRFLWCDD